MIETVHFFVMDPMIQGLYLLRLKKLLSKLKKRLSKLYESLTRGARSLLWPFRRATGGVTARIMGEERTFLIAGANEAV